MNIKKIIQPFAFVALMLLGILLVSCDDMNAIQRIYADREEEIYLGKVDSIKSYPGFGRVKLTWFIPADPKIDQTIIYWNLRKDSVVKAFTREVPGIQKDSITIENLEEGSSLFEFKNMSKEGYTSLFSSITATIWGQDYADGLRGRSLVAYNYDYLQKEYKLEFSPASLGDGVVYTEIRYDDMAGLENVVKVDRDSNQVTLSGFPDNAELTYRTVFLPAQGIDTVYNSYVAHKSPAAVPVSGILSTLTASDSTKFFERNGEKLYEWKANGDVNIYNFNGKGDFVLETSYPGLVPRTVYRDFFFYNDDKFIGIGINNYVYMLQISEGKLNYVKTPAGADHFGTGFTFNQFIPTVGHFFSISAAGEVKTWAAKNNSTWGSPNGGTVGTNFDVYKTVTLFNNDALLGIDEEGYLWAVPASIDGSLGKRRRIGMGWKRFVSIQGLGNHLLATDVSGKVVVFENFSSADNYWIVND